LAARASRSVAGARWLSLSALGDRQHAWRGRVDTDDRRCGRARPDPGYTRSSATRTSTVSTLRWWKLRALYGWPAPEDPDGSRDDELTGRELIAQPLG
jgi:hypothetical protein